MLIQKEVTKKDDDLLEEVDKAWGEVGAILSDKEICNQGGEKFLEARTKLQEKIDTLFSFRATIEELREL